MTQMTPFEIRDAANAIGKEIGPNAKVLLSFCQGKHPITAAVYTNWPMGTPECRVEADDWTELFDLLQERWNEHKDEHRARTIRKMALEIIRVTAEQGECTDAALRARRGQAPGDGTMTLANSPYLSRPVRTLEEVERDIAEHPERYPNEWLRMKARSAAKYPAHKYHTPWTLQDAINAQRDNVRRQIKRLRDERSLKNRLGFNACWEDYRAMTGKNERLRQEFNNQRPHRALGLAAE